MEPIRVKSASRRRSRFTALIGFALLALPPSPAAAQDRFEPVREFIQAAMAERQLPSVAVAVAHRGEIVWQEAFGWADRERGVAATAHTPYSLASISKPITATAIVQLAERGRLDLDAEVNRVLGQSRLSSPAGEPTRNASLATVRHVLSHTAGLPLHYQFFYDGEPQPPTRDETIRRYGVVVYPPGERYEYSNFGYGLLDRVIELAGGAEYGHYLRTHLFEPLGLTQTALGLPDGYETLAAVRYDARQQPIPFYGFDHDGASAIWSSAHDLVRFGVFHLNHGAPEAERVLSGAARRAMQERATPLDGEAYGLGWLLEADDHGLRRVYHSGSMPGVSTMLSLYPDEELVVVVLLNTLDREMRVRIGQEIAAAVVPQYARALRRTQAGRQSGAPTGVAAAEPRPARSDAGAALRALAGAWHGTVETHEGSVPLELSVDSEGRVSVRLDDAAPVALEGAGFRNGVVTGRFAGRIATADAAAHDHILAMNLVRRGNRLEGRITALSTGTPSRFALSSFALVERRGH
jgi:CubicO group peptidase (beta-lactamase class C family)